MRRPPAHAARRPSPAVVDVLRTIMASARCQMRAFRGPSLIVLGVVQPTVFLLVVVLARGNASGAPVADLALGTGLLSLWGATIWQCGYVLLNERRLGTLSAILARPSRFSAVLVGKCVGGTLQVASAIAVTVWAASWLFVDGMRIRALPAFLGAVVCSLVSAVALGMMLAALFLLTRAADRIAEALLYPVFILGGLLIPISLLPEWVRPLTYLVSLRPGADLVRAAAAGRAQSPTDWLLLAATTTGYVIVGVFLLRWMLHRARRVGSLDLL